MNYEIEREARVEAGAKALVTRRGLDWTLSLTDKTREHYLEDARAVLAAADAAQGGEAVGALFQHSETGRTRVVLRDQVADCDARWFKVGDLVLMTRPAAPEPTHDK